MSEILILGAGLAGLELATLLSEELGQDANVTLVEEGDAFVFGYSKLDGMFGRATPEDVRLPYAAFAKPGVRLVRERIIANDARCVTTGANAYEADVLAVESLRVVRSAHRERRAASPRLFFGFGEGNG